MFDLFRWKKTLGYIHIPKTGGTYLAQRESNKIAVLKGVEYLGHTCVITEKKNKLKIYPPKVGFLENYIIPYSSIRKFFLFSTVRNLYEWLVSYYYHAGGYNPKYRDTHHYDYINAKRGFEYLLKTIAERDGEIWPNRRMIHFQLFADNGALVVDWINRTETLDNDLKMLAEKLSTSFQPRERQRVGKHRDYRSYYSDELVDLVSTIWSREMRLFGFRFGETLLHEALIKNSVSSDMKKNIQYYWKNDLLKVNGEVW